MQTTLRTGALAAFALALAGASQAKAMPNGEPGSHWGQRLHAMLKYANLTPEQSVQVRALLEKAAPQRKALRVQEFQLKQQMGDKMLSAGAVSASDFSSLIQQDAQIHQQLVALTVGLAVQVRELLTPAQIGHLAQVHQQMESLKAQRRALLHEDASEEEGEGAQ